MDKIPEAKERKKYGFPSPAVLNCHGSPVRGGASELLPIRDGILQGLTCAGLSLVTTVAGSWMQHHVMSCLCVTLLPARLVFHHYFCTLQHERIWKASSSWSSWVRWDWCGKQVAEISSSGSSACRLNLLSLSRGGRIPSDLNFVSVVLTFWSHDLQPYIMPLIFWHWFFFF